jgi:hypothetical protein
MEDLCGPTSQIIPIDNAGVQHHGNPTPPACDAVGGTTVPVLINSAAAAKRIKASVHPATLWSGGFATAQTHVPTRPIKFAANLAALSLAFTRGRTQPPTAPSPDSVYLAIAQANETDERFDTVIAVMLPGSRLLAKVLGISSSTHFTVTVFSKQPVDIGNKDVYTIQPNTHAQRFFLVASLTLLRSRLRATVAPAVPVLKLCEIQHDPTLLTDFKVTITPAPGRLATPTLSSSWRFSNKNEGKATGFLLDYLYRETHGHGLFAPGIFVVQVFTHNANVTEQNTRTKHPALVCLLEEVARIVST